MSPTAPALIVNAFNARHPVGIHVRYTYLKGDASTKKHSRTDRPAWLTDDNKAVVSVLHDAAPVPLEAVEVLT